MPARALGFASGLTAPGNIDLTQFVGSMVGNITAANSAVSALRANITAANSAITTANVGMKTYVDTQVASAVIQASGYGNSVVAVYLPIDSTITSIQANVTAANANISILTTNAASQSSEISGLRANITAANVGITALRANITASNVNISTLQTAAQYLSSNIDGSIFSGSTYTGNVYTSNTYTGNAEVTGNLTVGNINASGNLIMTGTDATTIRFVRSVDSSVTSGEIYGNIDFAGENSVRTSGNTRARISVTAIDSLGATDFKFYTSPFGTPGIGFLGIPASGLTPTPNFTVNAQGFYGTAAGFDQQMIPSIPTSVQPGVYFGVTTNDGSTLPIVTTAGFVKNYAGYAFYEPNVGQTFTMYYAGFPGGDRANVNLQGYFPVPGTNALSQGDTGTTQIELAVMGTYIQDASNTALGIKRLRKRLIATIAYSSSTGNFTILDQQLCEAVYNSDATNWPAGAVNAGKVFLQANATPGYQTLNLRFDAPTGAAVTSVVYWQWTGIFQTLVA
jgi:hypothetical protein